jgi:hypothetical protein
MKTLATLLGWQWKPENNPFRDNLAQAVWAPYRTRLFAADFDFHNQHLVIHEPQPVWMKCPKLLTSEETSLEIIRKFPALDIGSPPNLDLLHASDRSHHRKCDLCVVGNSSLCNEKRLLTPNLHRCCKAPQAYARDAYGRGRPSQFPQGGITSNAHCQRVLAGSARL